MTERNEADRLRSARRGREPSGSRWRRACARSTGCGSASSTTPNGTPTGCCARPSRSCRQEISFAAVNYYRKESFSKDADPALIAAIAADNDIVVTAIGD